MNSAVVFVEPALSFRFWKFLQPNSNIDLFFSPRSDFIYIIMLDTLFSDTMQAYRFFGLFSSRNFTDIENLYKSYFISLFLSTLKGRK